MTPIAAVTVANADLRSPTVTHLDGDDFLIFWAQKNEVDFKWEINVATINFPYDPYDILPNVSKMEKIIDRSTVTILQQPQIAASCQVYENSSWCIEMHTCAAGDCINQVAYFSKNGAPFSSIAAIYGNVGDPLPLRRLKRLAMARGSWLGLTAISQDFLSL